MNTSLREYKTVSQRRTALQNQSGVMLDAIGINELSGTQAPERNCENMIGTTAVPLGVAGPLSIEAIGESCKGIKTLYLPLATTEGALVASINRGCKACTETTTPIRVYVKEYGATRGPVFYVRTLEEGIRLESYIKTHWEALVRSARSTSSHISLTSFSLDGAGPYRYVRFVFTTGNAMGLNMVTLATEAVIKQIEQETGIVPIALSGNYCVDKKASWMNMLMGRGRPVRAEITIPSEVLKTVLKTSARSIYDVWMAKCMMGSIMSGSLGWNAQAANVLAALFLATGQDLAHTVEGSQAITTTQIIPGNNGEGDALTIGVYLPDCMVGTVGGGTALPTQKEALALLGVDDGHGPESALWLSAIVGAAVLTGELSLLASLAQGTLAGAHARLARGKNI